MGSETFMSVVKTAGNKIRIGTDDIETVRKTIKERNLLEDSVIYANQNKLLGL